MNEAEYITPTTWEQCARHVEAGGIVEVQTSWGAWEREWLTPRTYRRRHGAPGGSAWVTRRLVPIESAAPVPPWPGDENDDTARLSPDQGDRIVNACCRMLGCEPADIDGDAALEEILTEAVERCADLHGQDRWEDDCHGCGFRVGDHTTDGRCPAPAAPVPPWPGAVLSGLCDEDGVPTWLAQAGQVRGEQVRDTRHAVWAICEQDGNLHPYAWVEVRAPRAVPEPETERVPWYRAMGRTLPYGELLGDIVQAYPSADSPGGIYVEYELPERNTTGNPHRDDADGTVEVLKDGES